MPVAGAPVMGTPVVDPRVAPAPYVERRTTYVTPNDPADLL
jgi:hypothetical protein